MPQSYLFSRIAAMVNDFKASNPNKEIISLGIGDVTAPLAPAICRAIHTAAYELSRGDTFKGYGPEHGHMFLRHAIAEHDYRARGIDIDESEIFISDGAKSDLGNLSDLFSHTCKVAVTDPVYPVYVDTNVMGGRAGILNTNGQWSAIEYLPCTEDNGFCPTLPQTDVSVIYLCYPNNPTGTVLSKEMLAKWVNYALEHDALIIFDSAYEAFITDSDIPHSIYEITGAKQVAVEVRSFSKTAGFTGLRCGYTVVPKELTAIDNVGNTHSINKLWERRQSTKFNGASYVSQRAAEAAYTPDGQAYIQHIIKQYLNNASLLLNTCRQAGLTVYGGVNAPYIWMKVPAGYDSWSFFKELLSRAGIICTPGVGFGPCGEGFVRLTAFNTPELTTQAASKIATLI